VLQVSEQDNQEKNRLEESTASNEKKEDSIKGDYINSDLSKSINITVNQEKVKLKLFGEPLINLECTAQNEYRTNKWYMSKMVFVKNDQGQVEACKIYNSRNGDYVLFHKNKLDSSGEDWFSKHLIFYLTNYKSYANIFWPLIVNN